MKEGLSYSHWGMCCKSMWQQWGPQREIMERGLQSIGSSWSSTKKYLTSSTRYQEGTERQQQKEEGRGQKWRIQIHGVWQKCWHMGNASCKMQFKAYLQRLMALWIMLCCIAWMIYLSRMLSISLQGLESRQVDICSYLGQQVFNGHYWLAISWIQCPRGNIFLIQFQ